jgi:large repetitive protein
MAIGITCAAPPQADIGAAYSHLFPVTGDTPPDVFSITVGALPAGLSIAAATGLVTGTPTGPPGVSNFTVSVTDSVPSTAAVACSITVNAQLILTANNPPNGYLTLPYSHAWVASGGVAPYTFQVQSGALPNGLTLNTVTGVISGTPTTLGLSTFTIRATDALGSTADVTFGIWVRPTAEASNLGGSGNCAC